MSGIRVLLVDDHLVVRSGLRALLGTQPDLEVVAEASSGGEALQLVREHAPDVVVMDLAMGPGMDGIEAIRQIRDLSRGQAVLVFTTYDSDADIVRAVDSGAMGYRHARLLVTHIRRSSPAHILPRFWYRIL